jgi:Rad3-related DNA helicase
MKHFPYENFQGDQEQAIKDLLAAVEHNHKYIELSAPTASGKTVVLYTVGCNLVDLGFKVLYTTPQIALLDQIEAAHSIPILKGLKHYYCPQTMGTAEDCIYVSSFCDMRYTPSSQKCNRCDRHCTRDKKNSRNKCPNVDICGYVLARTEFDKSSFAATTLSFALADPRILQNRGIVFIDESSGLEDKLLEITTTSVPKYIGKFTALNLSEYILALRKDLSLLYEYLHLLDDDSNMPNKYFRPPHECNTLLLQQLSHLQPGQLCEKLEREIRKMERLFGLVFTHNQPYLEFEVEDVRKIKLLYGRSVLERVFKDHQLVFASGTPTTNLLTTHFRQETMAHPIPKSQREIFFLGLDANLSKRSLSNLGFERCYCTVASAITQLEVAYGGKHTLVHCIGYNHANQLAKYLEGTVFLQDVQDREAAYEAWLTYPGRSIFLSVGREEGIDLKGEEYNLNFVAKLPWGNLG